MIAIIFVSFWAVFNCFCPHAQGNILTVYLICTTFFWLKGKVKLCESEDKHQVVFWQQLGDCLLGLHLSLLLEVKHGSGASLKHGVKEKLHSTFFFCLPENHVLVMFCRRIWHVHVSKAVVYFMIINDGDYQLDG